MSVADDTEVRRHWSPDSGSQDPQALGPAARGGVLQTGHPLAHYLSDLLTAVNYIIPVIIGSLLASHK